MSDRPLRRFNRRGIVTARRLVEEIQTGTATLPGTLLDDPSLTEPVADLTVDTRDYATRRAAGMAMRQLLEPVEQDFDVGRDTGLWTWLAFAHIDHIAPEDETGRRDMKEEARWVLDPARFDRYYRHLLAGPYSTVRIHEEDLDAVEILLCRSLSVPGDIVEQFSARQDLVRSPGVMGAATTLYVDPDTGQHRRGAASHRDGRPGNARRFIETMAQLDVTWHLPSLPKEKVLELLPEEFDEWRAGVGA